MAWNKSNLSLLVLVSLALPATVDTRSLTPPVNGIWDLQLSVNRMVGRDGFIKKQIRSFEWVVRFKQDGTKLTGDLVGGRGSRSEGVCADAAIEGAVTGESISFSVTYQGACCSQEQENFSGTLAEDGHTLSGSLEPADVPKTNCTLAYADVKGTKR